MKYFLEKLAKSILIQSAKTLVKRILNEDKEKKSVPKNESESKPKNHPWRVCPVGEHWTRSHSLTVPVSKKNPDGKTIREGHCTENPKRHRKSIEDDIEPYEIHYIAETYFATLSGPPSINDLGFKDGNKYDHLIRGWTKYWNDIFKSDTPLDPNLVTDQAIKALSEPNNEVKDHYVKISKKDASDPNVSLAAGIRWLFHKKRLASGKLGREATWEEAIAEYKAYSKEMVQVST